MSTTPIRLWFQDGCEVQFSFPRPPTFHFDVGTVVVGGERYHGEYTVEPSEETQVLPTEHKALSQDVTVLPIPSNYGRIAWDGTAIMVY